MSHKTQTIGNQTLKARKRKPDVRVLLVEETGATAAALEGCHPTDRRVTTDHAATHADAEVMLDQGGYDLALIADRLPDGDGIELAMRIVRDHADTRAIVLAEPGRAAAGFAAIRAGITDVLLTPFDYAAVEAAMLHALDAQKQERSQRDRVDRLRRLCKKLNQARLDVTDQVDVLCNDLVSAYQELANQMQHVAATSEYHALVRDELDLEQVLRKTLEYAVDKAGPTNAAIFLPATMDEYSLGGYVNYDCTADSADMLLDHLADVLAPRVADRDELVHLTDNDTLAHWIGDDAAYLADSHVIAFAAHHDGEPLAVVALFRDGDEPFHESVVEAAGAVSSVLGETLARVIKVHHRNMPDDWTPDDAEGYDDDAMSY